MYTMQYTHVHSSIHLCVYTYGIRYKLLCVAQKLSNRNVAINFIASKNSSIYLYIIRYVCVMCMFDFHRQIVSYYDFFMSGWLNPDALFIKPNDIVSSVGWVIYIYGLIVLLDRIICADGLFIRYLGKLHTKIQNCELNLLLKFGRKNEQKTNRNPM